LSGLGDFGTLETFLTFDAATRFFSFEAASNTLAGTYVIVVQAVASTGPVTNADSTITLTVSPQAVTLTQPATMPTTWAYTVNDGTASLSFDAYTCN